MAPLSDIVVSKLHRDGFPLLKSVLNECIVLLETKNDSFGHVDEFGNDLLGILVNVALTLNFLTRFSA